MPRSGDQNQALRSSEGIEYATRMIRRCIQIVSSVDQQDRDLDLSCSGHGTDGIGLEISLLLRDPKSTIDDPRREKEWRSFVGHSPDIRERFGGNDCRDAPVNRRFLQRHGRTERRASKHDWSPFDAIDHSMEITLFVETICAEVASRLTMGAAVVGNDVETALTESLDDCHRAAAVVGNAVEINDRTSTRNGPAAFPAFQLDAITAERGFLADRWRSGEDVMARWM